MIPVPSLLSHISISHLSISNALIELHAFIFCYSSSNVAAAAADAGDDLSGQCKCDAGDRHVNDVRGRAEV